MSDEFTITRGFVNKPKGFSNHNKIISEVLKNPTGVSNDSIMKVLRKPYRTSYGKKKMIEEGMLDWLRAEINKRNRNGIFIYANFAQRKRYGKTAVTLC